MNAALALVPSNPKPKSDEQLVHDELGQDAEYALVICDRLAADVQGLETVAEQVTNTNGHAAACRFYRWRIRSAALARIYARAMQSRSHVIANRLLDEVNNEPDPHKARVKMDAMKWLAAKFNRADFGDDPHQSGVNVVINNNDGASALDEIRSRLARKRQALTIDSPGISMLSQTGGRVEEGVVVEGGEDTQPPVRLQASREAPRKRPSKPSSGAGWKDWVRD